MRPRQRPSLDDHEFGRRDRGDVAPSSIFRRIAGQLEKLPPSVGALRLILPKEDYCDISNLIYRWSTGAMLSTDPARRVTGAKLLASSPGGPGDLDQDGTVQNYRD